MCIRDSGYVADGAPIFSQGYKYSPVAHLTYGLVGDTDILKTAPQDLIQAGYGDVVGKITAIEMCIRDRSYIVPSELVRTVLI